MFSLQKILGKEDKFFDLFEESAAHTRTSIDALVSLIKDPKRLQSLEEFSSARREEKKTAKEISDALINTFVTALDREDIEALAQALYKIPKTVEKVGERILLAPQYVEGLDFTRHVAMLQDASTTLCTMVKEMRKGSNLEEMRSLNARLHEIESNHDELMMTVLKEMYGGKYEPMKSMFLMDLFELIEKAVDRFRDAGNVINHIALKNS
ncbi:MAG: DUF47 domain-containing protein [Limisphaerales bacterium]